MSNSKVTAPTQAERTAEGVAKARAKRKLRDERLQSEFAIGILTGLGADESKHVYGGTVDPVTVQNRRVKNREARASRRINRRRSK